MIQGMIFALIMGFFGGLGSGVQSGSCAGGRGTAGTVIAPEL